MNKILTMLLLVLSAPLWAGPADYTWTTVSKNSSESMPCGGGDIGLNVWVEDRSYVDGGTAGSDLLFYISRSGAYDEHGTLLKQGRVRMTFKDAKGNPIKAEPFRQTLKVNDGHMEVCIGDVNVRLWVDVFRPLIHVETTSGKAVVCDVKYENWRYADRQMRKNEGRQNSLKWAKTTGIFTTKDSISAAGNAVTFYHKNPAVTVFDRTVEAEGMASVKHRMWNPLAHLVSGGRIWGDNLAYVPASSSTIHAPSSTTYVDTDYREWLFRSVKPAKKHALHIALHIEQAEDAAQWERGLAQTIASVNTKKDEKASRRWWNAFWQRSFIEADGAAADIARNYTLFRYMLGCNAYGKEPTKFNGGLFTFDPSYVKPADTFTPDFRNWGGGTMTAQNQRLVYWPMLKSGDFDMMKPQFEFYLRMLGNAELRSEFYWGHRGGCFGEQIELFGLPNFVEYGQKRPEWFDKGVDYNAWLEYEWDTVLEFCMMILETRRYASADIQRYMPLIESALIFFDEHYQYLASRRGRKKLDGDGKLILFPGSACETYKMTNNASSTVAALHTVLTTYIEVKEQLGDTATFAWKQMLGRIPEIPMRQIGGKTMISPAKTWERVNNVETPQLYPVFPWRMYGIAKGNEADLEIARNTYFHDPDALKFRSSEGWKQDNIWAACLGLTDEAVRLTQEKFGNCVHRFPAFWGPGFDWTPDHNRGGSAMIGLQEMLMQTDGDKILLFPAWKKDWDVRFKLHAPKNTIVEAELKDGKVVGLKVTPEERTKDVLCM